MKHLVEDPALRANIVEYLALTGVEVDQDTPVSITLPGAGTAPQKCASGSGRMTAGGRFAPGFDAKLKSALYAIVRGEPNKIPEELLEHGPMYRPVAEWTPEAATAVLEANGWPLPTAKKVKEPKAPKAEGDTSDTPTRKGRKAKKEGETEADSTEDVEKVEETV